MSAPLQLLADHQPRRRRAYLIRLLRWLAPDLALLAIAALAITILAGAGLAHFCPLT